MSDLMEKVEINFFRKSPEGLSSIELKLDSSELSVTEQRHRLFGRCYTIYPEKWIRDLGIHYIKIWQ